MPFLPTDMRASPEEEEEEDEQEQEEEEAAAAAADKKWGQFLCVHHSAYTRWEGAGRGLRWFRKVVPACEEARRYARRQGHWSRDQGTLKTMLCKILVLPLRN